MMNLFAQTLADHLKGVCRKTLAAGLGEARELRIFLSSFPPVEIWEALRALEEFILSSKKQAQVVFKVGAALWLEWGAGENGAEKPVRDQIEAKGWVDHEDHLTYYRNLKRSEGYDALIVVLVGVEKATDQASLQDFYVVDSATLWRSELAQSFIPWLEILVKTRHIDAGKEHIQAMDEMVRALHKYATGDLVQVGRFLEGLDLTEAVTGLDAQRILYGSLDFWGLPPFRDLPPRRKGAKLLKEAISFFSYQKYLKESDRKKALRKIDRYHEENGGDAEPPAGFEDMEDFLSCLRSYISKNDLKAREKLLCVNFIFILEILGIKEPKPPVPPKMRNLEGPPLEVFLTALWETLIEYKRGCDSKHVQPGKALEEIRLRPLRFRHNLQDPKDARCLIRGCLGGIDAFLEEHLQIVCNVDNEEKPIILSSHLCPIDQIEELILQPSKTAMPGFQFSISFKAEDGLSVARHFQWNLPEAQPYRNLWNLYRTVRDAIKTYPGEFLPVFTIPYYDELFLAPDEEEVNRVMRLGMKGLRVENLLLAPNLNTSDPALGEMRDLAKAFGEYLQIAVERGLFTALETSWGDLFHKAKAAFRRLLALEGQGLSSELAPILYKAFMILREPESGGLGHAMWTPHVDSALITSLHPCLLEMLRHRKTFLIHGFTARAVEALDDATGMRLRAYLWQDVCDVATIHYPLFGVICNANRDMNTDVTSFGLVHRVGKAQLQGSTLAAKMVLRHNTPDDERMADADLFRQTRESRVITRALREYTELYPHVEDGLSLAVLNVRNLQTVIAGIDEFLRERREKVEAGTDDPHFPYHFSLTIFLDVGDSQPVGRWLQEWRKRWSAAGNDGSYEAYEGCRLSVAQRIVRSPQECLSLLEREGFEADISLLPHFIDAGAVGNDIIAALPYQDHCSCHIKFPIVEVPHCADTNPALACERKRIISNRQFDLPGLHAELSARFRHPGNPPEQKHLVISRGDFTPWIDLVDQLHRRSTWVVCLDPSIDERLIARTNVGGASKRQIIGFSSGLGAHGELNTTVSTERASLADVEKGIRQQVNLLFGPWREDEGGKVAHRLVQESCKLSGLSLVRATGPSQYVRDLMAYTLVRICLPAFPIEGVKLCDELISLDTYRHWFDAAVSGERPDLLRLAVFLKTNGHIEIRAQLIECKLAKHSDSHLQKAQGQLENGLRHLSNIFRPRHAAHYDRFDQRFWWGQLQRLIAGKSVINTAKQKQEPITAALEALGEGRFDIRWQAMAVTFWTDSESNDFVVEKSWSFEGSNGEGLEMEVISTGKGLVRRVCCDGEAVHLPLPQTEIALIEEDEPKADVENESLPDTTKSSDTEPVAQGSSTNDPFSPVGLEAEPGTFEVLPALEITSVPFHAREPAPKPIQPVASVLPCIPERVLLGRTKDHGREVYWEFGHPQLSNRHILIFGRSGSGKTYAIQAILCELGLQGQNSVIVDYTDGFEKKHLEYETIKLLDPKQHFVYNTPLPISPFRQQQAMIGDELYPEKPSNTAQRVMSVFASVYNLGDQQKSALYDAVKEGIETFSSAMDLDRLVQILEKYAADGMRKDVAASILTKIKSFVDGQPFGAEVPGSWINFYEDPKHRSHIIQLTSCGKEFSRLVTEFSLIDLFWFARASGDVHHPKVVVLDEIQNLDHSQEGPIASFLTEGRKFGLSMVLATQTLKNLKEDARSRLFQASHKLFFCPAETELQEYAKILEVKTGESAEIWKKRLSSLGKGECYSLGPYLNQQTNKLEEKVIRIGVTALGERLERHEHAGE